MSLRTALIMTFIIQFVIRVSVGVVLIDIQYEVDTPIYKYFLVFSGLIMIVIGFKRLLTIVSVLRNTR
jgi:hypothetical protein